MVLQGLCGRAGHRRTTTNTETTLRGGLLVFKGIVELRHAGRLKSVGYPTNNWWGKIARCSVRSSHPNRMGRKGQNTVSTHSRLSLAKGVVVENMGTTVLVMVPRQNDVLTLTGRAAEVVTAVTSGAPIPNDLSTHVNELVQAGVLTHPMSRRSLIRAGAIGAGAGIAVLAMPGVAAASSTGGGGGSGGGGSGGSGGGGGWEVRTVGTDITLGVGDIPVVDTFEVPVRDTSDNNYQIPNGTLGTVASGGQSIAVVWQGKFVPVDQVITPQVPATSWYGVEWTLTFSFGGSDVVLTFTPVGAI